MTKRGKELKFQISDDYNIVCGTVDSKDAKAVYVNISAWGEPTSDKELNYGRVISRLAKCVKQSIYNYLKEEESHNFYCDRTIVDLDMRESGIKYGKRSFMNCEITIYQKSINDETGEPNEGIDKEVFHGIIIEAIDCLNQFDYFDFYRKKK